MSGICGFASRDGAPVDTVLFEEMNRLAKHRGPDDEGTFYEGPLALGHRRLAVIDLSRSACQPMTRADRYTVVFDGTVFNYVELRAELENDGCNFATASDTEVLLAAYVHWGPGCVNRFNGVWAFAIYDAVEKTLFLSRDRLGAKPLYYLLDDKQFAFASEIKQLLPLKPEGFCVNTPRVWDFLYRGFTEYDDSTFFEGIRQLEGGHEALYQLKDGRLEIKRWYSLNDTKAETGSFDENAQCFRTLFEDAVRLNMRADVPVGSCLSGGLDSSAIVCVASRILAENPEAPPQHTISSVYDEAAEAASDEQEYIDAVAAETGVVSHKVRLRPQHIFDELDSMLWHNDEPYASTSPCAQWTVFQGGKEQGLTVMLDGQGSDEQLAGYSGFFIPAMAEMIAAGKYGMLRKTLRWFKKNRSVAEKVSTDVYLSVALSSPIVSQKKWMPRLLRLWLGVKQRQGGVAAGVPMPPLPYDAALSTAPDYYGSVGFKTFTLNMMEKNLRALLHYDDRNAAAHSVESRVPFLDYRLVEALYAMPFDHKLRNGVTKAVMREGLRGVLTEKVRTRFSKLGFATPEEVWMRQNPQWFRTELAAACDVLAELLDKERVLAWFDACRAAEKQDYLTFRMICLGRWVKLFNLRVH